MSTVVRSSSADSIWLAIGAVPDQFVEPRLIAIDVLGDIAGRAAGVGRAHRFVRFLRVLRLVLILARRVGHVFLAVLAGRCIARMSAIASGAMSTPSVRI